MTQVETIAQNIVKYRKLKGLTQNDVAEYLGMTRSGYANYELGLRSLSFETALQLGELFGVSTNTLGYSEEESPQVYNQSEAPPINHNKPECDFDDCEIELVQKYRKLDNYGKEVVNLVADAEVKRCEEQNTTPELIRSFIAAHSVDNHEPKIAYMEDLSKYPVTDEEF